MAAEGEFPKVDGDIFYGTEASYIAGKIQQIYASTGFDTSQAGSGTDTDDHELTAIVAADMAGFSYVEISILCLSVLADSGGAGSSIANTTIKIEAKETGGAYGNILAATNVDAMWQQTGTNHQLSTIRFIHTLTAGEKTNGVQFKITSTSDCAHANLSASLTNKQTVVRLC